MKTKQERRLEEFDKQFDYVRGDYTEWHKSVYDEMRQFINDNYISKEEEDEIYKNGWDNACKAIKGFIDDKLT